MEVIGDMLAERIIIAEGAEIEPDLMECKISHDIFTFLEKERFGCEFFPI